jgi:hypothetical protein
MTKGRGFHGPGLDFSLALLFRYAAKGYRPGENVYSTLGQTNSGRFLLANSWLKISKNRTIPFSPLATSAPWISPHFPCPPSLSVKPLESLIKK